MRLFSTSNKLHRYRAIFIFRRQYPQPHRSCAASAPPFRESRRRVGADVGVDGRGSPAGDTTSAKVPCHVALLTRRRRPSPPDRKRNGVVADECPAGIVGGQTGGEIGDWATPCLNLVSNRWVSCFLRRCVLGKYLLKITMIILGFCICAMYSQGQHVCSSHSGGYKGAMCPPLTQPKHRKESHSDLLQAGLIRERPPLTARRSD